MPRPHPSRARLRFPCANQHHLAGAGPNRGFRPPLLRPRSWIGQRLTPLTDGPAAEALTRRSRSMAAPKRLAAARS